MYMYLMMEGGRGRGRRKKEGVPGGPGHVCPVLSSLRFIASSHRICLRGGMIRYMVQLGLRDDEISVGLANKIVSLDCQLLCCSVVVGLYAVPRCMGYGYIRYMDDIYI
jgi:hypothetical protein